MISKSLFGSILKSNLIFQPKINEHHSKMVQQCSTPMGENKIHLNKTENLNQQKQCRTKTTKPKNNTKETLYVCVNHNS
jgi:hypothetical protein